MQYLDIRNMLGQCVEARLFTDMPNTKFRDEKDYISASGLKDYLSDPELALRTRVLKTSPKPKHGTKALSNFRMGRAIHAYGLEGDIVYKKQFPVFSEGSRVGKRWEMFKEQNPESFEADDILTPAEDLQVHELGEKLKRGVEAKIESFQQRGWETLGAFPEVSILAKYACGISLKVRLDALFILRINGQLYFMIEDVKTTSKSVSDTSALAMDTESFKYHLQGIVYLLVTQDALSIPPIMRQLSIEPGMETHLNIAGQFNILWLSKVSHTCGFHEAMLVYGSAEDGTWDSWALPAMATSLVHYKTAMEKGEALVKNAAIQNNKDTINEAATFISVKPSGRMKWSHGSYVDVASQNKQGLLMTGSTEATVRKSIKISFPPEFVMPEAPILEEKKPDVKKPAKKKKAKPVAPPKEVKEVKTIVKKNPFGDVGPLYKVLTKENMNEFTKAQLHDHPVVQSGQLMDIDWSKNIMSIKAAIRKDIKRLGKDLDQVKIINDYQLYNKKETK